MSAEQFDVPVKTWLRADVYRQLHQLATERDTTVAVLVAVAATKAATPRAPQKRKRHAMTPDRLAMLAVLLRTGMTMAEIAARLGVSRGTVYNHIERARSMS